MNYLLPFAHVIILQLTCMMSTMMPSMMSSVMSSVMRMTHSAIEAITQLRESVMIVGGFSSVMVAMVIVVTHRMCYQI